MSRLIRSVSDSVSSRVCWPTTLRSVVWAIWSMAACDVLDRHHGLHRVDDPEVGHGGDVDADVVAGDDALGLDRHGHDPQRHPVQHVDERDDQPQAGLACPDDAAEPEQHALLVLLDDAQREREDQCQWGGDHDENEDGGRHWRLLGLRRLAARHCAKRDANRHFRTYPDACPKQGPKVPLPGWTDLRGT